MKKNNAADKLVKKAREYLAVWKDGEVYHKRMEPLVRQAGNPAPDQDTMIGLAVGLSGPAMYRSALAGTKFLTGDPSAWQDFIAACALSHWAVFTSAAAVGRTRIITHLKRFNSAFETDIALGLCSAIWTNRTQYLAAYREWLPLIQQHKLLGQFDDDEEQIHFAYYVASKRFDMPLAEQFHLHDPHKAAMAWLAAGNRRQAYIHLLDDHLERAARSLRYEKAPYFPNIGYGLIPVEVLALWELEGDYDEMISEFEHPLLSPLYKNRETLHAVQLEPEIQFIEEAASRFISTCGGVTGV